MPDFDPTQTVELGRPWFCPNRHILGYVIRVDGLGRLHIAGGHVITGQASIHCDICGADREWHWGDAAISRLTERVVRSTL